MKQNYRFIVNRQQEKLHSVPLSDRQTIKTVGLTSGMVLVVILHVHRQESSAHQGAQPTCTKLGTAGTKPHMMLMDINIQTIINCKSNC